MKPGTGWGNAHIGAFGTEPEAGNGLNFDWQVAGFDACLHSRKNRFGTVATTTLDEGFLALVHADRERGEAVEVGRPRAFDDVHGRECAFEAAHPAGQ